MSAVSIHVVLHTALAIRYITFSFDPQLSQSMCNAIKERVTLFQAHGMYNLDAIIEQLPNFFVAIKSLEIEQFPQHMALLTIKAFDPIVRVNDDRLLMENQAILPAGYYAHSTIASLQKIMVASPILSSMSPSIMTAMKRCLAEKIFDHYTVYLVSEHEWYLEDAKDPLFTLCCNASSLPVDMLHMAYNRLKNQIKKGEVSKKKWIADMRFHDQIILSMNKGGRYG